MAGRDFRGQCCKIRTGSEMLLGLQGGDEGGPGEVLAESFRAPHCFLGRGVSECLQTEFRLPDETSGLRVGSPHFLETFPHVFQITLPQDCCHDAHTGQPVMWGHLNLN